ncbi:DUF1648 domain-containing protein [Paenibacillus sp. P22]|uniref:DUF1648 domain-containing protein n=1 Tax=Paenibacillus sp. P22 TaxID=483908 RepID=UPI00039034B0|nr:DUF5808 domain-containing protein [Paenibacillus sp. P22]CDN42462.1 hypothetical protein BN871_BH_00070 [Paenibacillus sp. P22]
MNMSLYGFGLTMGAVYVLVLAVAAFQPSLAPRNILFGISIPKSAVDDDAVRKLRRSYTGQVIGYGLAFGILVAAGILWKTGGTMPVDDTQWLATLPVGALLALFGISGGLFVAFHQKAERLKRESGWQEERRTAASLSLRKERLHYPLYAFAPHLLVILISAGAAWLLYDKIPDSIITHYNARGIPDRIQDKSYGTVFEMNLVQLFMLAIFIFVNYTTGAARMKIDPADPERSEEQQRRYRKGMSLLMLLLGLGMVIFMGFLQAFMLYGGSRMNGVLIGAAGIAPLVMSAAAVVSMMKLGKGRMEASRPGEDAKWKAGAFYWDRSDSAIFVEKRTGIGFTLNWGHPVSWVILAIILGFALAPLYLNP